MQISEPMIRYHLRDILLSWFNSNDLPPDDVNDYYKYVLEMQKGAVKHGDMDVLKLAFEYILSRPEFDCTRLDEGHYPYESEEIREIIFYAWQTLWGNDSISPANNEAIPLTKDAIDIEFVAIPIQEWWASRQLEIRQDNQLVTIF